MKTVHWRIIAQKDKLRYWNHVHRSPEWLFLFGRTLLKKARENLSTDCHTLWNFSLGPEHFFTSGKKNIISSRDDSELVLCEIDLWLEIPACWEGIRSGSNRFVALAEGFYCFKAKSKEKKKRFYIRQGRFRREWAVNESVYIALTPALSHGYVILSITTCYTCSSE